MNTNYIQVADMTKEEKIAMYMKCTKRELIEMLIENQELLMQAITRNYNPVYGNNWPPTNVEDISYTGTDFKNY